MKDACVNGHLEVARWLAKKFRFTTEELSLLDDGILEENIRKGRIDMVEWLTSFKHA